LSLGGLNAHINNCEQISHRLWLLYGDSLNSFEIADPVTEGINDLNVLDVQDFISGIVEMFHVVPEALIMLLLDGL
jgi:hypothetical protein